MILGMLKRYGDQRFIGAPFTSISHGQRTAERPRRCGTGTVRPIPASTHTIREEPFSGADDRGEDEHLNFVNQTSPQCMRGERGPATAMSWRTSALSCRTAS